MESSFLIEVDNTSILRTGALHCYHYTLNRLPAPRLLLPRSGLERSDFVHWPIASFRCGPEFDRYRGIADMAGLAGDPIPSRMTRSTRRFVLTPADVRHDG